VINLLVRLDALQLTWVWSTISRIPDSLVCWWHLASSRKYVTPADMLSELHEDEKVLVLCMRTAPDRCDVVDAVATTSLIQYCIDQTQRHGWFLFEAARK
jgi:hypothetical protein